VHLPVSVLENQISMMCVLKDKIEKMPYGTTQEV
jgi:hypothetical protein